MVMKLARADVGWLVALCSAELGTMLLFSSFSAVIPVLQAEWRLSNVEVGFILSAYQVGYTLAVAVLATLTDWISARRIYIVSALWAAGAGAGFAITSDDVVTGLVWRTLAGVGLAGTYMPGLRLVTERFGKKHRGVAIGSYTGTFVVGTSISLLLTSWAAGVWGWRAASGLMAIGPLAAALIVVSSVRQTEARESARASERGALIGVLGNRAAMRLIGAYGAHTWELMGMRGWILPFLVASLSSGAGGATDHIQQAGLASAAILAIGAIPHPIAGLCSDRWGRRRLISSIMLISGACSVVMGWTLLLPFATVIAVGLIYGVAVTAESAVISTAIADVTEPAYLGRTMALQSTVGFAAGALAPLTFGIILDVASHNGATGAQTWALAFSGLGIVALLGPMFAGWRDPPEPRPATAPSSSAPS